MNNHQQSRRKFVSRTAPSSVGLLAVPSLGYSAGLSGGIYSENPSPVWKNQQEGMHYRMLGRTGMMVSEIVLGTFPFTNPDCYPLFDESIARGINYFDCGAAYSKGQVESNLGNYFKASGNRDQIFLATKLSAYYGVVDRLIRENIAKRSPAVKRELQAKTDALIEERMVQRSGYYIQYFGGQAGQFSKTYYRYLAMQEIGIIDEWREQIMQSAYVLLEQSLTRLQTDHVDVLHIPHGVAMPEMMDTLLGEIFVAFKQKGLIKVSAVSFHNDVTGNLLNAQKVGYYDVAMFAYNIANHAGLEHAIYKANQSGMGLIAMKVAKLFSMNNQPSWQLAKLNETIPDTNLSPFAKSYLWALQNPNLSCCVSQMETTAELNDNLQILGKEVAVTIKG